MPVFTRERLFIKPNVLKVGFLMQETKMGGIEYNAIHLAKALRSDFQIVFIVPAEGIFSKQLQQENLSYLICRRPSFISTSFKLGQNYIFNPLATLYNFLLFPSISLKLKNLFKKEKFQLIVTKGLLTNFYGSWAAKWAGLPVVWDMQEIVSENKALGFVRWFLNFWAEQFATRIVLPSKAIRAQFWDRLHSKSTLIPNGVDINQYHPDADRKKVRSEWGIKENEILITHIARFTYWKGQKDFVKAASIIKDKIHNAKFALVGSPVFEDDRYQNEVKEMVRDLALESRVLFPGFRQDLKGVLGAADIFVHSSIEPEGCPITLITAMSMGKPCVATDILGNNEIIDNPGQQALLVPPESPEAIARAILELISNPERAKEIQKQARTRIEQRYSLGNYALESGKVFRSLAKA